jgi:hypothetical protein
MTDDASLPERDSDNPFAPPSIPDPVTVGDHVVFAPRRYAVIDGTVICDGEFDISPLCIETGEPVRSGDIKSYYTKLFAPSEQRQTLFQFLHFLHQSIFVTGFVMGILLRLGNERVPFLFGIPVGIPFFLYLGLMILVLRRIPSVHIIFRRSKEGSRQRVRRRAIPTLILAANLVVCLWALPAAFRANVFFGIAAAVVAMIIPTITLHHDGEPYATRDGQGRFHIHGLSPALLSVLEQYARSRGA